MIRRLAIGAAIAAGCWVGLAAAVTAVWCRLEADEDELSA